ncbi:MAG: hypothetical protein Q9217_000447 [Psora testacea]
MAADLNLGVLVCTLGQTAKKLEIQRTYAAVYLLSSTAFLDLYLQIPLHDVDNHTLVEKASLAHAGVVLIKLAFSTIGATPETPFPLRKACKVSHYMEVLVDPQRNGNNSSACNDDCIGHDPMWQYRDKVLRTKAWYDRMEYLNEGGNVEGLKGMSPLQLEEIAKGELPPLDIDWGLMDFMSSDVAHIWD